MRFVSFDELSLISGGTVTGSGTEDDPYWDPTTGTVVNDSVRHADLHEDSLIGLLDRFLEWITGEINNDV